MITLFNEENIQKAYGKEKFDEGEAKAFGLMSTLTDLLIRDGRSDVVIRAITDKEYRDMLLKEYQLA